MNCILRTVIDFENNRKLNLNDTVIIVQEAFRIVLGEFGVSKPWEVVVCAENSLNCFDIKIGYNDLHLLWAALSIYGCHFGQKLAIRIEKVLKLEE